LEFQQNNAKICKLNFLCRNWGWSVEKTIPIFMYIIWFNIIDGGLFIYNILEADKILQQM